jgi:hypothetical protein
LRRSRKIGDLRRRSVLVLEKHSQLVSENARLCLRLQELRYSTAIQQEINQREILKPEQRSRQRVCHRTYALSDNHRSSR